jgi:hypothetical protein
MQYLKPAWAILLGRTESRNRRLKCNYDDFLTGMEMLTTLQRYFTAAGRFTSQEPTLAQARSNGVSCPATLCVLR